MARTGRRTQRLAHEGVKFLAVGGVATLVALVLFNVLVHGVPGWSPGLITETRSRWRFRCCAWL